MRQILDWSVWLAFVTVGGVTFSLGLIGFVGWEKFAAVFTDVNAAWAQAGGAFLGLAVAIWAPYWHARVLARTELQSNLQALHAVVVRGHELVYRCRDNLYGPGFHVYMEQAHDPSGFVAVAELIDRMDLHKIQPPNLILELLRVRAALTAVPSAMSFIEEALHDHFLDTDEAEAEVIGGAIDIQNAMLAIEDALRVA